VDKKGEVAKPCLISCSVLKDEIEQLIRQGDLDVKVIFVSKYFHVDYSLVEKNLRRTIERTMQPFIEEPILVYGDLCLGPNGEMKKLGEEYGLVKVDALNCVDCLLGGKGKVEEADPSHELMFMDPGMIDFFRHAKEKMLKEGMDEETFQKMFGGIKGIVLLDTLGNAEKCRQEMENLHIGLKVLETKEVGLDKLKLVVLEAIQRNSQKTRKT
jgi:Protein of unknown function (DUF1638)